MYFLDERNSLEDRLAVINYHGFFDEQKVVRIFKYLNTPRYTYVDREKNLYAKMLEKGKISQEEYKELIKSKETFSYHADYDIIYGQFLEKYGINLQKDNIHWFEFTALLENLLLDDNNVINKRIRARAFEPASGDSEQAKNHNKYWQALKDKYSLS